jgi:hypothetical protein
MNLVVLTGEWRGRVAGIEGRVWNGRWPPAAAGNSTPLFTPLIPVVTCHYMKQNELEGTCFNAIFYLCLASFRMLRLLEEA